MSLFSHQNRWFLDTLEKTDVNFVLQLNWVWLLLRLNLWNQDTHCLPFDWRMDLIVVWNTRVYEKGMIVISFAGWYLRFIVAEPWCSGEVIAFWHVVIAGSSSRKAYPVCINIVQAVYLWSLPRLHIGVSFLYWTAFFCDIWYAEYDISCHFFRFYFQLIYFY